MINHDWVGVKTILFPHHLKDNQTSTRTWHLSDGAHEEVSVKVSGPTACRFRHQLALHKRLLVGVVVAAHGVRWLLVLVGLHVEGFEAAVVDILDLGQRVLDELRSDGRRDASQEKEHRLE